MNDEKTGYSLLSRREKEVLNGIRSGLPNKDIAEKLSLSESPVRVHLFNILAKLHLENRNQAIIFALRQADDQDGIGRFCPKLDAFLKPGEKFSHHNAPGN